MNAFASLYLLPPVSVVLLLAVALLWLARAALRRRAVLAGFCTALAVVSILATLPVVSKVMSWPLKPLVRDWNEAGRPAVGAVVVPTGGSYADPLGGRWPSRATMRRAVLGASLAAEHGLPLAISGGSPQELPFSEAALAVDLLGLDRAGVLVDLTARNTHENAAAFARLLDPRSVPTVLLVTDSIHMPRMAASLRAVGFRVYGRTLGQDIEEPVEPIDFIPSNTGLRYLHDIGAGYSSILYYLLQGRLSVEDVFETSAP